MELLVIWLICGVITGVIAANKGRSGFGWFLLGCVLGIFGVIFIALMPAVARQKPMKDCPDCGEDVLAVANVCRHCGYRFPAPPPPDMSKWSRRDRERWLAENEVETDP